MLRGCLLVLVLGVLLSPRPAQANWWRRTWDNLLENLKGRNVADVAALDTNGDGILSERELAQHFAQREDLDSLMTIADADGDDLLTLREAERLLGEVQRRKQ